MIEHQAKQGVDYMTIHAAILIEHLPLVHGRTTGIVSRGGSLHAVWMMRHRKQNPLYEHFDEVLEILRYYDVTISIGDSPAPGLHRRRERPRAVRRARHDGRAHEARVGVRRPGDDRGSRPHPDGPDRDEREARERGLSRSAVLHARSARHRHLAGLRPHLQRDRRGDDRLARIRHALLRHAEGAPRTSQRRTTCARA